MTIAKILESLKIKKDTIIQGKYNKSTFVILGDFLVNGSLLYCRAICTKGARGMGYTKKGYTIAIILYDLQTKEKYFKLIKS